MTQGDFQTAKSGRLMTSGVFVVHLRSNSDPAEGRVLGRIEHVVSGKSLPFHDLSEMLAFMARYQGKEDHVSPLD